MHLEAQQRLQEEGCVVDITQLYHQQLKTLASGKVSLGGRRQDLQGDRPPQAGSRGAESCTQGAPRKAQMT